MSHNISLEGGKPVRLTTGGKYCDRDIIISPENLDEKLAQQDELIEQIKTVLRDKAIGGTVEISLQTKSVTPTKSAQDIVADSGYDGLSKVSVGAIPAEYIVPTGSKDIVTNGNHNVTEYASVQVNVPTPDGYIIPSGTKNIVDNGTHDVKAYESVAVNVEATLQMKSAIPTKASQEIVADSGYDGLSKVNVGAIPDAYIIPVGTKNITESGTYDVKSYESVVVDVETSSAPDPSKEYQRVEYIESAEEETYPYIFTDIYADNDIGVELVASFPKLQDRVPMGSREDSGTTRFYCVYPMSSSSIYYGFNGGSSISCALTVDTIYRLQTNFLNSRLVNAYDSNGTRKGGAALSATISRHSVPIAIFGYTSGTSGNVSSKREYKLYSARISKGHEVIRDYVPCYRKSDGVVGLYEKVTGQFLTNDADTGSFAKGEDIEW